MLRLILLAAVVMAGCFAFTPTKANAGVYIRAPYFSLNVGRPYYGRRYYRRPYYGRSYYRRPYYRRPYYGRRYYRRPYRRWRRYW